MFELFGMSAALLGLFVVFGLMIGVLFGTSVIATLKHRDLEQVDYKLGVAMILGTTAGLEIGKQAVVGLQADGSADAIISVTYVVLLGGIGAFFTCQSLKATVAAASNTTLPRTPTRTTFPTSRRRFSRTGFPRC